ncbi:MAG: hypothetical protein WAM30_06950 [Candidatus Dormiibacterota bacterium]
MLGMAGTGLLASCGGGATSKVVASCVSGLAFPVSAPGARDGQIKSKVPNVPDAWTRYPTPWKSWTGDPPAKGGTVTAFEILWNAPPPQLPQNQWWQQLNRQLGASWSPVLADAVDYPAKLSALAASGSFPDITYVNFAPNGPYTGGAFEKFVDEGAFHDLTPFLTGNALKEYPNLRQLPDLSWRDAAFEGKIFGPPYPVPVVDDIPVYRKDWAEKLGVDNPKNAADIKKMFVAFANGDPNGNGKKDTWVFGEMDVNTLNYVFRVPNNWRLNKDGTLTKNIETEEYRAALDFSVQLWKQGAYHPDVLTNTYNQDYPLIESGHVGYQLSAVTAVMGQAGLINKTKQSDASSNLTPLVLPGHDGGSWAPYLNSGAYGFYAIPSSIKSESRIRELLRVLDWWTPPFGSEEYTFLEYGVDGLMYQMQNGAPVPVSDTSLTGLSSGLNYMCQPAEINFYYPGFPTQAVLAQKVEEQMVQKGVADPTLGLYSPTDVAQGTNLQELITNAHNDILVGRQPLSSLSELISSWKSQGGDQSRKEFEQALAKCK